MQYKGILSPFHFYSEWYSSSTFYMLNLHYTTMNFRRSIHIKHGQIRADGFKKEKQETNQIVI